MSWNIGGTKQKSWTVSMLSDQMNLKPKFKMWDQNIIQNSKKTFILSQTKFYLDSNGHVR